ncbi:MAG: hypothetical protein Q9163_000165 [Psora crenata]
MASQEASPQRPPGLPDIPYSAVLGDQSSDVLNVAPTAPIVADTNIATPTAPVVAETDRPAPTSASSTLVTVPLPTATSTASASSSPTPTANRGFSPLEIAAIIVPIVALVLLVPLLFLLYRSHQLKKAATELQNQTSSKNGMLQRQSTATGNEAPHVAPVDESGTKTPISRTANGPSPRPTNSLGLFNFDLSRPHSATSSPITLRSLSRLSGVRASLSRRSEMSVVDGPRSIKSQSITPPSSMLVTDSPPPSENLSERQNPHFAPLDQIGTAQARSTSRPNIHPTPSSRAGSALSRPSREALRPPSLGLLPAISPAGEGWGDRFTISDYQRDGRERRNSDISVLSDQRVHHNRQSQQSPMYSPIHDDGGTQPLGIV